MIDMEAVATTYASMLIDLNPTEVECEKRKNSNNYVCLFKRGESVIGENMFNEKDFNLFKKMCVAYALLKSLQSEYGLTKLSKGMIVFPSVYFTGENEENWSYKVNLNTSFKTTEYLETDIDINGNEYVKLRLDTDFV